MIRLCLLVEGQSEVKFFNKKLLDYIRFVFNENCWDQNLLSEQNLEISCVDAKGNNYSIFRTNLQSLSNNFDIVSTSFDYYENKFNDFKTIIKNKSLNDKYKIEDEFKSFCKNKICNKSNIIPFIFIYELETLLYSNIKILTDYLKNNFNNVDLTTISYYQKVVDIEQNIDKPSYYLNEATRNSKFRWSDKKPYNFLNAIVNYDTYDIFKKCNLFKNWIYELSEKIYNLLTTNQ